MGAREAHLPTRLKELTRKQREGPRYVKEPYVIPIKLKCLLLLPLPTAKALRN